MGLRKKKKMETRLAFRSSAPLQVVNHSVNSAIVFSN